MTGRVRAVLRLAPILLILPGVARADDAALSAGRHVAEQGVLPGRAACAACHLGDGAGQPEVGIPRLAGLDPGYLDQQLAYFAEGRRRNAIMRAYAGMLTPTQRGQVAAYYASLPVPAPVDPEPPGPDRLALGKQIVERGNGDPAMPSCSQCHGVAGLGVGNFSPDLAGQSAAYIVEQLITWHEGGRRDPKGAFMQAEAGRLNRLEINAVADYLASLPQGAPFAGTAGSTQKDRPR